MAHDHHFLERLDRVTREQTEFALGLYRDHEAVAYVLTHVNLPEAAARVALAVDRAADGPVVIVTRDGRFVTCLASGMRHDHPVVPHGQLTALLAKVADKRARRELAQRELRPDEEEGDLFHRVLTRGSRLAREDFMAVSAFEPLLGLAPFLGLMDIGLQAVKLRAAVSVNADKIVVNGATTKALEQLHRMEWSTAHMTVLAGAAERKKLDAFLGTRATVEASATFACSAQGGTTFFLRAAWMTARFGKAVIPSYKAALVKATDWMGVLDAVGGLAALAIRHSALGGEVRRVFEAYGPPTPTPVTPDDMRRNGAFAMLDVMDHVDERMEMTLKVGRSLVVMWSQQIPDGHPLKYTEDAAVPDELAKTAALAWDGNIFDQRIQGFTITAMATAARASAEDFYYPREFVRAYLGPWHPEESLARVRRWKDAEAKVLPTRSSQPGRNDPCTCGSGKKWKKCHGGPSI